MQTGIDTAPPVAPKPAPVGATPPGWGDDELTKFLQAARDNQNATYVHKCDATGKLIAIDAEFVKVSKSWLNPPSEILAMLFLRCHAAFRAAAGLAMSGQAVEAFVQCRATLENAAYAAHIHGNPARAKVWLDRHQSDADMKASRKAFRHEDVVASVTAANIHAGKRFEDMYQKMVDLGGHPNERSVTGNMQMIEEPDRRVMLAIFLHGDNVYLDHALKTVAQCGMISLEMLAFGPKFALLGIKAAMLGLRKTL
jgi:hypothetical protein